MRVTANTSVLREGRPDGNAVLPARQQPERRLFRLVYARALRSRLGSRDQNRGWPARLLACCFSLAGRGRRGLCWSLLEAGLLCGLFAGCVAPVRASRVPAELPMVRTAGDWAPAPDAAERKRLEAQVEAHYTRLLACVLQEDGPSTGQSLPQRTPWRLTFGVDSTGQVRWLELDGARRNVALHQCLSRRLQLVTFDPPPAGTTLMVLTLPPGR